MNNVESYYTRKFCRSLEAQGAITYPLIADEMTPVGWPDRYISHEICSCFLEFKSYNGRLSEAQIQVLGILASNGVRVYVVRFAPDWKGISLCNKDGNVTRYGRWSEFFTLLEELGDVGRNPAI